MVKLATDSRSAHSDKYLIAATDTHWNMTALNIVLNIDFKANSGNFPLFWDSANVHCCGKTQGGGGLRAGTTVLLIFKLSLAVPILYSKFFFLLSFCR